MVILDWIKAHQTVFGLSVVIVLVVGGGIIIFFVVRGIKKRLRGKQLDVPPSQPVVPYYNPVNISQRQQSIVDSASMMEEKMAIKKPVIDMKVPTKMQQLVDINQLTDEQLEQLLKERRVLSAESQKRVTLSAMSKEDLIQLIIDNGFEI